MELTVARFASPVGHLSLVTDTAGRLRALDFGDYEERRDRLLARHYGADLRLVAGNAPQPLTAALDAYFAGDIAALDMLETETNGTPFQRSVWAALRTIGPGETLSYGALAARIGSPSASRAVGLANGANPVAIVVPCHRVIGSTGALTGFGGGLERKKWLLAHEARHAARQKDLFAQ